MNWKNYVEQMQAKQYVLPDGWDAKEKVADDLGCSPESVRKLLAPAIKGGAVETKQFPVFCRVTKKVRAVTAYRRTGK